MLAKCRDLRTLPGTKFRLPGTCNYSAPLPVTLAIQCEHIEVTRGTHRSIKLEIDEIRRKRKNNAYGWSEKSICGDDDDKEHKRGENVSGGQQTGDDRSPTVSPRVRRVPANRFPLRSPNICQTERGEE